MSAYPDLDRAQRRYDAMEPKDTEPRMQKVATCPECSGDSIIEIYDDDGNIHEDDCPMCDGTGEVEIPADEIDTEGTEQDE